MVPPAPQLLAMIRRFQPQTHTGRPPTLVRRRGRTRKDRGSGGFGTHPALAPEPRELTHNEARNSNVWGEAPWRTTSGARRIAEAKDPSAMSSDPTESTATSYRRARWLLHPFLFALLPVISLYSFNIVEIGPAAVLRSAIVVLAGAALMVVILRRVWRDTRPAALFASLTLILMFAYGHVYYGLVPEATQGLLHRTGLIGDHRLLLAIGLVILAFGAFVVWRTRLLWDFSNRLLNWVALGATLLPVVHIVSAEWSLHRPWPGAAEPLPAEAPAAPPGIYYLTL